jgi:hypothetical protein
MDFTPDFNFTHIRYFDAKFPNLNKRKEVIVEPVIEEEVSELFEANQVINYIKGLK